MLSLNEFKKRVGITKNKYVQEWLDNNLIPGVITGEKITDAQFPESARRPYRNRWLKAGMDANTIRTHIIKACIKRQLISKEACFASKSEFAGFIADLEAAGLLRIRIDDGIKYYDSTLKSDEYIGRSMKELRVFVLEALKAVAEGTAKGAVEGAINALIA